MGTMMPHQEIKKTARPMMLYDGQCGFCKSSVRRMQKWVGDRIEFVPYQDQDEHRLDIPMEELSESIHLIKPDGSVSRGAKAILSAGAEYGGQLWARFLWWSYRYIPFVARIAEFVYARIADSRTCTIPAAPPADEDKGE
jgi:predicted DCC family thiol-disulfide oxidoreductase YuxK